MVLFGKNELSFLRLNDLKEDTLKFLQNAFDEQEDEEIRSTIQDGIDGC